MKSMKEQSAAKPANNRWLTIKIADSGLAV